MANTKSAQKAAQQNEKRRVHNLARKTALKNAVRRVLTAVAQGEPSEKIQEAFKDAAAQLSRAKGKGVIHANTAARKVGRLAAKVAAATRQK